MQRLRFYDLRVSRLPGVVGLCSADGPRLADFVNTAQRRLVYAKESGDEGWWGTWAEIAFTVSRSSPYITLPRGVARLETATVCDRPIPINNQFVEYLQFGNGRFPKHFRHDRLNLFLTQSYQRNNAVTFTDLTNPPQMLTIYSSPQDNGKRVLLQGLDNNNNTIYSQDGLNRVIGVFITLGQPFVIAPMPFNQITGIQKDITANPIQIFQADPNTGAQILLHTMEPGEQTASYRRYFFNPLPFTCCPPQSVTTTATSPSGSPIQVTAIVKLELIPVVVDTDYTLIQNMEAIIEECASVRYSQIDSPSSKQMAQERHTQAIRMLNGELTHYLGRDEPAVQFKPFGSARLERLKIGSML